MNNYGRHGKQRNQFLPTQRQFFNYGNADKVAGYNSFFSGTTGGNIVPDNTLVLNNDNSKVLFAANFDGGFDNAFDWALAFNGAFEAVSRNVAAVNGNDTVGPADISLARLPSTVDAAGALGDVHKLFSNNYIKIPASGRTYIEMSGVFEPPNAPDDVTTFAFEIKSSSGFSFVAQSSWNIDSFGAAALNPSGITLDFKRIQTVVIEINNRDHGNIKCGFLVSDIPSGKVEAVYWAHEFQVNNIMDSFFFGNLNLPVSASSTREIANGLERRVGLFDDTSGILFSAFTNIATVPTLVADYYLNSCVVYTVGADSKDFSKPFVTGVGGDGTYVAVPTGSPKHLFSIKPKDEIYSGVKNRTVYSVDQININTSTANPDDAVVISLYWNAVLTGHSFNDVSSYSALEIDTASTGFNLTNAIEIARKTVNGNQDITLNKEDILKEYQNAFSIKETSWDAGFVSDTDRGQLSVIATAMGATATINVAVNIIGGEVA